VVDEKLHEPDFLCSERVPLQIDFILKEPGEFRPLVKIGPNRTVPLCEADQVFHLPTAGFSPESRPGEEEAQNNANCLN